MSTPASRKGCLPAPRDKTIHIGIDAEMSTLNPADTSPSGHKCHIMTSRQMPGNHLGPPQGPDDMRGSFGDRRLDNSRKTTACLACRKQKIKCHMTGSPPCARCRRRGLPCTVNRPLQSLLEDDVLWKQSVTRKIHSLEALMETVRERLSLPPDHQDASDAQHGDDPEPNDYPSHSEPSEKHSTENQRRRWEVRMDIESAPAIIPAACVGEVTVHPANHGRTSKPGDLVSDGIITLQQADTLFEVYANRLDHYLYSILGESTTLATVRSHSAVLLAALCTVGSLHSQDLGSLFDRCHERFVFLSSRLAMAEGATLDDIRGLCIGAFWLHDLSWNLVSIAVRAATQIHLHRSFHKAIDGDRAAYLQTRLWYHVFVCDHHFSIPYGRLSMVSDCDAIRFANRFLTSPHATEDDSRLISQVEVWTPASRALADFGFNVDVPIPTQSIPHLRNHIRSLDTWRADWDDRFAPNMHVGEYPSKGVGLYYYFTKLYLCSHAFRGLAAKTTAGHKDAAKSGPQLHPELEEIGFVAVYSAKSILRTIIADTEIQSHLHGLSLYFDTMIIFAIVFLLKAATHFANIVPVDKAEVLSLVSEMSAILNSITSNMHRQHLLVAIARGVEALLVKCRGGMEKPAEIHDIGTTKGPGHSESQYTDDMKSMDQIGWTGMPPHNGDIGLEWAEFDFLANQEALNTDHAWMLGGDYLTG